MAKYRGKKALYEVIAQSRQKTGDEKKVNKQNTQKDSRKNDEKSKLPKKPSIFYAYKGRVEFSLPYTSLAVAVLGLILVLLLVYRLGQISVAGEKPENTTGNTKQVSQDFQPEKTYNSPKQVQADTFFTEEKQEKYSDNTDNPVSDTSSGDNRIVIQTCQTKRPLEPVVEYFAENNISTEIIKINNRYFLMTKRGFDNPHRKGTGGYKMRQRIIQLGAEYESPPGYASFGNKPFHDAYGMKFNN
jgi:hypothetical protein